MTSTNVKIHSYLRDCWKQRRKLIYPEIVAQKTGLSKETVLEILDEYVDAEILKKRYEIRCPECNTLICEGTGFAEADEGMECECGHVFKGDAGIISIIYTFTRKGVNL